MPAVGTAATQGKGQSQHQGHRTKEEVILIIVVFSSCCCDCRELIFLLTNIRRSLPLLLLPSPLLSSLLLLLYSRKRVYVYWLDAELIGISKYEHMLIEKLFLYEKNQSIYHRSDNNILYCIIKLSGDYFMRKHTTSNIILLYGCSHYSVGKSVARKVNSSLQAALRAHNMRAQHYSTVDFKIVIFTMKNIAK